jgi:hypothetical protein
MPKLSESKISDSVVVWTLLSLIATCLFTVQYSTLPRIKAFVLSSSFNDHTEVIRRNAVKLFVDHWATVLTPVDLFVICLLLFFALALVFFEIRSNTLSVFLSYLGSSPRALTLFLFLTSMVITRYYLNPGSVFMGDSETYTVRSWMVSEHLKHLQFPVWSNYWYGGFPLLEYYAPLLFVVVAVLHLVVQDIDIATKLLLWTSHVGSVFAMFYFLREVTRNDLSSLLGSVAYALMFHRIHIVLYQGDLHLALVFLLYPWIFLIAERYLNGRLPPRKALLSFSLAVAALVLTHHAYAFFGLVFVAVYLAVRVGTNGSGWADKFKTLGFFAFGGLWAFFCSAFSLLPFIMELGDVRGMPKIPFHLLLPTEAPSLKGLSTLAGTMVRWTPVGQVGNVTYVGISVMLLSLLSAGYAIVKRNGAGLGLVLCALLSFTTLKSDTMYNVKNFNFLVFFITVLTVYAPDALRSMLRRAGVDERLERRWGRLFEPKAVLALIALVLIDLGPTTFQSVYNERGDFKSAAYNGLSTLDRNYKVIERQSIHYDPKKSLRDNFDFSRLGIPSAYAPIQTPLGWFHEGSPKSISYNAELVKKLQRDLHQGSISDLSLKGLYLMGVKFVLFRDRYHYYTPPLQSNPRYVVKDLYVELKDVRPLLVSTKVMHVKDLPHYAADNIIERGAYFDREMYAFDSPHYEQVVRPLIDAMNIDLDRGTADYLILRDERMPQNGAFHGDKPAVRLTDFSVAIDSVTLKYASSGDGFAKLPYSYFPYLDVRIDGKQAPYFQSAMRDIVVPIYPGEHTIRVVGRASPLSRWTFLFSLASIIVVFFCPSRIVDYFARDSFDSKMFRRTR